MKYAVEFLLSIFISQLSRLPFSFDRLNEKGRVPIREANCCVKESILRHKPQVIGTLDRQKTINRRLLFVQYDPANAFYQFSINKLIEKFNEGFKKIFLINEGH